MRHLALAVVLLFSCLRVGETFKKSPTTDRRICPDLPGSCCTEAMEKEMYERADRIFKAQLQDKVLILRHLLHTNLNSFRSYFYNSLNTCHNSLDLLFKKTYGPFYEQNTRVFETFFNRLRAFSSPYSDANVNMITSHLFSQLYRVIFSLLNPMRRVSEAQWRCMEQNMDEIEPFGKFPAKINSHLEKALTNWRHFVSAIENIHGVLEGFMNTTLSRECVNNLVRMNDCSSCSVKKSVKPCHGFCINVMKGCLAEWSEIDHQWNTVVGALIKLSQLLRGSHNLQNALNPLPVQLSEAVMHFQEQGSAITNKALARCFPMDEAAVRARRWRRSSSPSWARMVIEQQEGHFRVARQLMTTFGDRLILMRGWFRHLPSAFCSEDGLSAPSGDRCWNGTAIADYQLPIAASGVSQQAANPEYQKERFLPYRGLFVEERLKLGVLSFRLNNILHGRNYSNYEVEGSAESDVMDDEDYAEGSGDIIIAKLDPSDSPSSAEKIVKSSSSLSCSILSFSLIISLVRLDFL